MKNRLPAFVNWICGLLLAVGPWTVFSVCPAGEKLMACYYAARAVSIFGILLMVFGVIQFIVRQSAPVGCLFSVAAYLAAASIPAFAIRGCANTAMACRQLAFPFIYLVCILGCLAQAGLAIAHRKKP